jgi:hypothetical protein
LDPGFDLWCGESLCRWKVLRGEISREGTWHGSDSGVGFRGDDAAIEQRSTVDSRDGNCIAFKFIANVDDNAEVFLHIDVFGDGSVERSERVPTSRWKPVEFNLLFGGYYEGIRFELAKTGPGSAVLAQISAEFGGDCSGKMPIESRRPLGVQCTSDAECASQICRTHFPLPGIEGESPPFRFKVCMGCDRAGAPCPNGTVCGVVDPSAVARAGTTECVARNTRELGEICISDDDCVSGKCSAEFSCSACDDASDCGGATCGVSNANDNFAPNVCRPNSGQNAAGAPCSQNDDCASGSCSGTPLQRCEDGRPCLDSSECPTVGEFDTPGTCTNYGVEGGTCS